MLSQVEVRELIRLVERQTKAQEIIAESMKEISEIVKELKEALGE